MQRPKISLKPGERLVLDAPSPQLQGKFFGPIGTSTSACKTSVTRAGSSEMCDSYPVEINASNELIKTGGLQLNITLEWAKGVYFPNCPQIGNCGSNEMSLSVYQDPPKQYYPDPGPIGLGECALVDANVPANPAKDEIMSSPDLCGTPPPLNTFTVGSRGLYGTPDTPLSVAHIGAGISADRFDDALPVPKDGICRIEYVNIGNYSGSNPYKLTIELADYSGASGLVDHSFDEYVPPDLSASAPDTPAGPAASGGFGGADSLSFGVPGFGVAPVGVGAPRVDLPGLGGSAGFDGIGPGLLDTSDLAKRIVDRGPKPLGAAAPANGLLLFLWLVLLPLGGLCSFLFFVWRRRRDDDPGLAAPAWARADPGRRWRRRSAGSRSWR